MKNLLDRYLFLFPRAPEGAGGDGAAAAGSGSPGAAAAPGSSPGQAPGEGGGQGGGAGGGDGGAAYNPAWPDGFPEQLRGKSEADTYEKVNQALKGYRERDAQRDIPTDPKGYLSTEGLDNFEITDQLKPYFEQLQSDPVFEPMAKAAKEMDMPRPMFLGMWKAGMEAMSEAGMLEPAIDPAAERAALLPEAAKTLPKADQDKAIDKRMEENNAFVDLMVTNKDLPADVGEYAKLMLGDSARGHQFLEWVRGVAQGQGGSGPGGIGGQGGGDTRESLKAELAKPEMQAGHPQFDRKKYDELDARYKKLLGSEGTK